jgi:hypothetical protein
MAGKKKDLFKDGTSNVGDFFYWINERQRIWWVKEKGFPAPWTKDPILHEWSFCNVYRQWDRGTIALREMVKGHKDDELMVFNVWWYRLFNWHEHTVYPGWCDSWKQLNKAIRRKARAGQRIFTNAHMYPGIKNESKHETYLRATQDAWHWRKVIHDRCRYGYMERVFRNLLDRYYVGKFTAYEIVCDLRFCIKADWHDRMTWANIGPGATRGLRRLGLPVTIESMRGLLALADRYLDINVHYGVGWPFELREIEHSLCEFDKYERTKSGLSRPRRRYPHTPI